MRGECRAHGALPRDGTPARRGQGAVAGCLLGLRDVLLSACSGQAHDYGDAEMLSVWDLQQH